MHYRQINLYSKDNISKLKVIIFDSKHPLRKRQFHFKLFGKCRYINLYKKTI